MGYYSEYLQYFFTAGPIKLRSLITIFRVTRFQYLVFSFLGQSPTGTWRSAFGQSPSIRSRTVILPQISVAFSRYRVIQNSFISSFDRWRLIILLLSSYPALASIQLFKFPTSIVHNYQVLDHFKSQLMISCLNYLDLLVSSVYPKCFIQVGSYRSNFHPSCRHTLPCLGITCSHFLIF